jgi:hypothetical protein
MDTQAISHHASGNQANHNSMQVNGPIGDRVEIQKAVIKSFNITPLQARASTSSTIEDDFYFGPIPAFEEDEDIESEAILELPPSISEADFQCISNVNSSLMEKYEILLNRTPYVRATCVKQLRAKASDQKMRIKIHITLVEKGYSAAKRTHESEVSIGQNGMEDLKQRLANIHDKLQDAINSCPRVPARNQVRIESRGDSEP